MCPDRVTQTTPASSASRSPAESAADRPETEDVIRSLMTVAGSLAEADLSGLDLSRVDLRGADLSRARLASTDLTDAILTDATMICPLMERTNLTGADLRRFYAHALSIVSSNATGANLAGAIDCTGSLFHGVDFTGADLSGGNFAGSSFYQCTFRGTKLRGTVLSGSMFNECVLDGADLSDASVDEVVITRSQVGELTLDRASGDGLVFQTLTRLGHVRASGTHLPGLRVRRSRIGTMDLSGATADAATFEACTIQHLVCTGAALPGCRMTGVSVARACFDWADLTDASLTDSAFAAGSFAGAKAENGRMLRCSAPGAVFSTSTPPAVFSGRGFTLRDCDLSGADFTGAYLYRASFTGDPVTGMILDGARFTHANLIQGYVAASMVQAELPGLRGAYLRLNQTDLSESNLTGANLYQASLVKTVLRGTRLTGVRPPVFLDRCPGLQTAEVDEEMANWLAGFSAAVPTGRRGST